MRTCPFVVAFVVMVVVVVVLAVVLVVLVFTMGAAVVVVIVVVVMVAVDVVVATFHTPNHPITQPAIDIPTPASIHSHTLVFAHLKWNH